MPSGGGVEGELDFALGEVGSVFLHESLKILAVINGRMHDLLGTTGEFEQFIDHVRKALDLLANTARGGAAHFGRGFFHVDEVRGEADDIERVFKIMNDGSRESANESEPFDLEHFANVLLVKIAELPTEFANQADGEARAAFNRLDQGCTGNENALNIRLSGGGGGAGRFIEDCHFSEEIAGCDTCESAAFVTGEEGGNIDGTFLNEIKAVTGVAFIEDDGFGREG